MQLRRKGNECLKRRISRGELCLIKLYDLWWWREFFVPCYLLTICTIFYSCYCTWLLTESLHNQLYKSAFINDINNIDTNNEHVKQQHNCCNLYYYDSPLTLILSCNLQTRHNTSEVYNELICWLVCNQYQILMRWCYLMHNIWYYEVLQKSMINESTQLTRYGKVNLEQIFFV